MTQEPPVPSESRWTKRITIIVLVCMLVTFLGGVVTVIWIGLHVLDARHDVPVARSAVVPPPPQKAATPPYAQDAGIHYQWELHSARPFGEVRIPFEYSGGSITTYPKKWLIFVKATLAGVTSPCIVDTGAAGVCWPQSMKLKGEHHASEPSRGVNNSTRQTDSVVLSRISLGGYQVTHLPTGMIKRGTQELAIADAVPIIGNIAFYGVVLTIDYQNKILIVRKPEYDVLRLPRSKEDMLLDFDWVYNEPVVHGVIEGISATFLMDTGDSDKVSVERRFWQAHLSHRKLNSKTMSGAFGKTKGYFLDEIHCKVGSVEVCAKRASVPILAFNVDGIIGKSFLEHYNVTIDYPRRKILLHRNALPDTTDKNL